MMGSDISYQDYMEDPTLSNIYNAEIVEESQFNNRSCYVLKLTAKVDDIAYYTRKLWVDKENFLPIKQELNARSGSLLKTSTVNEIFKIGERWYPRRMTYKDVMLRGDGTEITCESIEFDVNIPGYVFSKASLHR